MAAAGKAEQRLAALQICGHSGFTMTGRCRFKAQELIISVAAHGEPHLKNYHLLLFIFCNYTICDVIIFYNLYYNLQRGHYYGFLNL